MIFSSTLLKFFRWVPLKDLAKNLSLTQCCMIIRVTLNIKLLHKAAVHGTENFYLRVERPVM